MKTALEEGSNTMTYKELEINTEIVIREKPHEECRKHKTVKYTVVAKYPSMCIAVDRNGRRRGIAIGELVMNKVITQEPYIESLRNDRSRDSKGWRKKNATTAAEYAP